jgi:hypothetical protein
MRQFIEDVELVFDNCRLYNGEASWISEICKKVQEEFLKQCELLNIKFYIDLVSDHLNTGPLPSQLYYLLHEIYHLLHYRII